jgi:hypothetical protein
MAKLVGVPRLAQPACLLYVMLATVLAHDVMVLRLYTLFRGKERVGGLRGARNKTCLCFYHDVHFLLFTCNNTPNIKIITIAAAVTTKTTTKTTTMIIITFETNTLKWPLVLRPDTPWPGSRPVSGPGPRSECLPWSRP